MVKHCQICQLVIRDDDFESHLSGKRHLKNSTITTFQKIDCNMEFQNMKPIFEQNISLESQLESFLHRVGQCSDKINTSYGRIKKKMKKLFKKEFPLCTVQQSGSTFTGLCLNADQTNIYMNPGEPINRKENGVSFETSLNKKFFSMAKNFIFRSDQYINVKVFSREPKITFFDKTTNVFCELRFNNCLNVDSSRLIKHCISMDKRLKPLIMIIKYWIRIGLSKKFERMEAGNITSYALVMLFIFYLQQDSVNLLPSIISLKRNCIPQIINGWQVNFDKSIKETLTNNESSIPELLYGFFHFYANFDFEKFVICPIDGCAHPKEAFKDINNLPESMDRYKKYVVDNEAKEKPFEEALLLDVKRPLCIQDPIELNKNCSYNVSNHFVKSFQARASTAAKLCDRNLHSRHLLFNLFAMKPEKENNVPSQFKQHPAEDGSIPSSRQLSANRMPAPVQVICKNNTNSLVVRQHAISASENKDINQKNDVKNMLNSDVQQNSFENEFALFLKRVEQNNVKVTALHKNLEACLKDASKRLASVVTVQQISSTFTGLCSREDTLILLLNVSDEIAYWYEKDSKTSVTKELFSMAKYMCKHEKRCTNVKKYPKVPKITFCDRKFNIPCEIYCRNCLNLNSNRLLKHYISNDPRFKPLIMIIKHWMHTRKKISLHITSNALGMLLIFFLQQDKLVPPVISLKRNCIPEFVNGWQVNFDENIPMTVAKNQSSIPELLYGFFHFYANFNFEKFVICPIDGCAHSKDAFENISNLPESMERYKKYIEDNKDALILDIEKPLCIQDPIELNKNCSDNLSRRFIKSFQEHASIAAEICTQEQHSQLLINLFDAKPYQQCTTVFSETMEKICYKMKPEILNALVQNTNFEDQLTSFLNTATLNDDDIAAVFEPICERLNKLLRKSFPMCHIYRFGSTLTGLCIEDADLDIYLKTDESINSENENFVIARTLTPGEVNSKMALIVNLMVDSGSYTKIMPIPRAKTPIVNFKDKETGISCDLSFTHSFSVNNSFLLRHYLSFDTRLKPLIIIIKYWAKRYGLKRTMITSYDLVMLVVFYLQQNNVNLVPPILSLRMNCVPKVIDGWQVNFDKRIQHPLSNNKSSIPELLFGFFNFYANFNFEELVICPLDGCAHAKTAFENLKILPESMNRYKDYMKNTKNAFPLDIKKLFCLQDPTQLNINRTANVSRASLNKFRNHAIIAAEISSVAHESDSSQLLLNLFGETAHINKKETKHLNTAT